MAVKGLKLSVNLRCDSHKVWAAGEYKGEVPEDLVKEFEAGSPYLTEIKDIPSVKPAAPPISSEKTVATKKTPPRTAAKKTAAKTKTAAK